ncbi:hypothetical protein WDR10_10825 [Kurthia gibsonii]|uniref:hypothetical protein n=1 Tax=Kurthia gibsonii TaxID=33946 RepID=UPI0030D0D2FB
MKKLSILFMLMVISLSTLFSPIANAKTLKDSPQKGYIAFFTQSQNKVNYYKKPNGKKSGTIPTKQVLDGDFFSIPNTVKVIKPINKTYVKVRFAFNIKLDSKKKQIYTHTGYIKWKDIRADAHDFMHGIVKTPSLALKSKASSKSKTIIKIPLGTRLINLPYSPYNDKWCKVKYIKNKKVYVGYVEKKWIF